MSSNRGEESVGGHRARSHAAALRRMVAEAPPFRPDATDAELVAELANGPNRWPAFLALYSRGEAVLPSIRQGFEHPDWQVRRWCALFADNFADVETLRALVPLLDDPKSQVRQWAVHSLSCESCKDGANPLDGTTLLLERLENDGSLKVRRQAVAMLAHHRPPEARVVPAFERILADEEDPNLRFHAERGLERYREAGLG